MAAEGSIKSSTEGWFLTPQVSTLGVGINIGKQINENFTLRANINGFGDIDKNIRISGINYETKFRPLTAGLLLDYHPFDNGFKFVAGAYYNRTKISTKTSQIKYNGHVYDANDLGSFSGSGYFNNFAPYLGIGYQTLNEEGLSVSADLGVMYHGSFKSSGSINCYSELCRSSPNEVDQIRKDANKTFDKEVNHYKFYPVISLGLTYRF